MRKNIERVFAGFLGNIVEDTNIGAAMRNRRQGNFTINSWHVVGKQQSSQFILARHAIFSCPLQQENPRRPHFFSRMEFEVGSLLPRLQEDPVFRSSCMQHPLPRPPNSSNQAAIAPLQIEKRQVAVAVLSLLKDIVRRMKIVTQA